MVGMEEAGGHGHHGQQGRSGRGCRAHLALPACLRPVGRPCLSPEFLGHSPKLSTTQSLPLSLWHLVFVRR